MKRFFAWLLVLVSCGAVVLLMISFWPAMFFPQKPDLYEGVVRFQISDGTSIMSSSNHVLRKAVDGEHALMIYRIIGTPSIEQLVNDLELSAGMPRLEDGSLTDEGKARYIALIEKLREATIIDVEIDAPTLRLVSIKVLHEDAELASRIANRHAENYMRTLRENLDTTLHLERQFYEQELHRWLRLVDTLETDLIRLKWKAPGIDLESPLPNHQRLSTLHAQMQKLELRIGELQAQSVQLQAPLQSPPVEQPADGHDTGKAQEPEPASIAREKEVAAARSAIASLTADRERLAADIEVMQHATQSFFQIRGEFRNKTMKLKNALKRMDEWDELHYHALTAMATLSQEGGIRCSIIQRAPDLAPLYVPAKQPPRELTPQTP